MILIPIKIEIESLFIGNLLPTFSISFSFTLPSHSQLDATLRPSAGVMFSQKQSQNCCRATKEAPAAVKDLFVVAKLAKGELFGAPEWGSERRINCPSIEQNKPHQPASNLFAEKKTKLPSQGELLLFFRSAEEELWPRLFAHLFQFGSGNESTVSDYHCSSAPAPAPQLPRNSCRGGGSDQKKPSKRWKAGLDQSNPSSFKLKSKSILLQDKKFSWHWTSCCWSTRNAGVGQVN